MAHESAAELLALHGVRVKGFAATPAVAEATGLSHDEVERVLGAAQAAGHTTLRSGAVSGWSLTPAGRERHRELLAADVVAGGYRDDLGRCYDRFLPLNEPFKALCTCWQTEGQPSSCVDRLVELHRDVAPLVDDLAAAATRFGSYGARFETAVHRLKDGDRDALTKPLSGSYHDVWMELHQDLLMTLDRERSAADGH